MKTLLESQLSSCWLLCPFDTIRKIFQIDHCRSAAVILRPKGKGNSQFSFRTKQNLIK